MTGEGVRDWGRGSRRFGPLVRLVVGGAAGAWLAFGPGLAAAQEPAGPTFEVGDVFVALDGSQVQWRRADGTLVRTLSAGAGQNAGMGFDTDGNLYVTDFSFNAVNVFDPAGQPLGSFGTAYDASPESIAFDVEGNVFVGQADGTGDILKFVAGLEATALGLLPFRFLDGSRLRAWNQVAWIVLFGLSVLAFVYILINPISGYLGRAPAVTALLLFLGFGAFSAGFWAYFRYRKPKAPRPAGPPGATWGPGAPVPTARAAGEGTAVPQAEGSPPVTTPDFEPGAAGRRPDGTELSRHRSRSLRPADQAVAV